MEKAYKEPTFLTDKNHIIVLEAIIGAANAAILAVQILAVEEPTLADKLAARRASDREKVLEKNQAVENEFNL